MGQRLCNTCSDQRRAEFATTCIGYSPQSAAQKGYDISDINSAISAQFEEGIDPGSEVTQAKAVNMSPAAKVAEMIAADRNVRQCEAASVIPAIYNVQPQDPQESRYWGHAIHRKTGIGRQLMLIRNPKSLESQERLRSWVDDLLTIRWDGIVKTFEVFADYKNLCLVSESCTGGTVYDRILHRHYFTEQESAVLIRHMLQAVSHLHEKHLFHGHLAPDSFRFLNETPHAQLKLVDFGLELKAHHWDSVERSTSWGCPPCPPQFFETCKLVFLAPEVAPPPGAGRPGHPIGMTGNRSNGADFAPYAAKLAKALEGDGIFDAIDAHLNLTERERTPSHTAADIWSVGAIAFLLLCGYPPFFAPCKNAILGRVQRAEYAFDPPFWSKISEEAKDFVLRCLQQPTEERLLASEALVHPWVSSLADSSPSGSMFSSFLLNLRRFYRTSLIEALVANSLAERLNYSGMQSFLHRCREVDVGGNGFFTATDLRQVLLASNLTEIAESISTRIPRSLRHPGESYIDYTALVDSACCRKERHFEEDLWQGFQRAYGLESDGRITVDRLEEFLACTESRQCLSMGGATDEDESLSNIQKKMSQRCKNMGTTELDFFDLAATVFEELPPWPTVAPMTTTTATAPAEAWDPSET